MFAGSVVLANILAAKLTYAEIPRIGGAAILAGFVAFGVAYLASDLLVEYCGREEAHSVVNATVGTLVVTYMLIFIAIWMPPAPFWENQSTYEAVFGNSASIVLASIIALGWQNTWTFDCLTDCELSPVENTGGCGTVDRLPQAS